MEKICWEYCRRIFNFGEGENLKTLIALENHARLLLPASCNDHMSSHKCSLNKSSCPLIDTIDCYSW